MVNDVPIVPVEREPKDALAQLLVDDVRDERKVLQVARRLVHPQGEVPCELNELGSHHQHVAEIPIALRDADLLDGLRLEAVLPALVRVEVVDILLVRVHELVDTEDDWNFFLLHVLSSWGKKEMLMWFLRVVGW